MEVDGSAAIETHPDAASRTKANRRKPTAAGITGVPFGTAKKKKAPALSPKKDPYSGHLFLFRSKRGDYLKCLYWDTSGLCLFAKQLEKGKFVWPTIAR